MRASTSGRGRGRPDRLLELCRRVRTQRRGSAPTGEPVREQPKVCASGTRSPGRPANLRRSRGRRACGSGSRAPGPCRRTGAVSRSMRRRRAPGLGWRREASRDPPTPRRRGRRRRRRRRARPGCRPARSTPDGERRALRPRAAEKAPPDHQNRSTRTQRRGGEHPDPGDGRRAPRRVHPPPSPRPHCPRPGFAKRSARGAELSTTRRRLHLVQRGGAQLGVAEGVG